MSSGAEDEIIFRKQLAKLCWGCQSEIPDDAAVCPDCDVLQFAGLRRVWHIAALCVGLISLVSVSVAVTVVRHYRSRSQQTSQQTRVRSSRKVVYVRAVVLEEQIRKVYPYSMVPGGAASVEEARMLMSRPELRINYGDVILADLHQVKLEENLSEYVSYRYGEKIYWTSRKLTLRAGETVFTDGKHVVRGRCLNRLSAKPMTPIRPKEPSEKVMNAPVDVPVFAYKFPLLPVEEPMIPAPPGELTPTVPVLPTTGLTPTKGGFWFPILPIIPPIHRHHPQPAPPGVVVPPSPPSPPVAVVPEPGYFWLLLAGFLTILAARGIRTRAITRVPNLSMRKLHPGGIKVVDP